MSLFSPPPSARITQISVSPDRLLAKAIRVPSGEKTGWRSWRLLFESCFLPVPSAFISMISLSRLRSSL